MNAKEFWKEYEIAHKEHRKWEKRADKVVDRYRQEQESEAAFNILWANTSVLQPALFSQVPKPDIRRRYRDDDPLGKQGSKVLERGLEFVMDDGDYYTFGLRSVLDYLLPGRTVCKIRYQPLFSRVRKEVDVEVRPNLSPEGTESGLQFFVEGSEIGPEEVQFREDTAFIEREIEEVVDESVVIERWPWKNFIHQKAKRWEDVGWVDYISFLDRDELKARFGSKAKDIKLTVDGTGEDKKDDGLKPTHAEVHEVWFKRDRKVKVGVKGLEGEWLKEGDDPLRLNNFFPTPKPLFSVDTNDSLMPIPIFTLYQHQANELDTITRRISVLMGALKVAGLYAGSEKATLQRLFESDENTMIAVPDWSTIQGSGGLRNLVDWLPIDQIGKVLTALFQEREQIVQQIFELTGLADIQRGSTDARETARAQVLKAQFSSQRTLTPKQQVEIYFRDTLRIAAEIIAEHFSADTLQRMTGLQVPDQLKQLYEDELSRQYRIDIETDSTVAPDEERDKQEMAQALEAVTAYISAMFPLVQAGVQPQPLIVLLKTYLRKFRFGREIEEMLEELERQPPQQQQDPEQEKMQMEAQIEQAKAQADIQKKQAEMQIKQQEMQMRLQEMMQEMQIKAQQAQQELRQDQQKHLQELSQDEEAHRQELAQKRETDAVDTS